MSFTASQVWIRPCLPYESTEMTFQKSFFPSSGADMVRKKQSAKQAITEADLAKEYAREIVSYFGQ